MMTVEQVRRLVDAGEIIAYRFDPMTGEFTDIKWRSDRDQREPEVVLTMDGRSVEVRR